MDLDQHPSERDLRAILLIQAIRAYLYGLGSVVIGASLAAGGLSSVVVGWVFTAMLAGMAASSAIVGLLGERLGRRRLYVILLLTVGAAGSVFAVTTSVPLLVVAALTGCLSTDPNESGPITSIEQAMIGEAPAGLRLRVFGRYNAIAYVAGAVGALAGALPGLLDTPARPWLWAYPVLAVVAAWVAGSLSGRVEAHGSGGEARPRAPLRRSRRTVSRLASLFALDSFAGGFIVQSFVVFWFGRTLGASIELMGAVFFVSGLLQAASSIVASRVAERFGMLNTMVFTHLPSNILLMLVPVAPGLAWGIVMWLARVSVSQMDVPARQAYVVALVDPEERVAAAAFTNTARYVSRPIAPAIAGALMHTATALPFLIAGAGKIVYDLLLLATFRRVELPGPAGR
ncbi:MAG TPA: MFS transporter [Actinomycetota bacterium]